MHKPAIAPLVFSRLFPNPKASDPTSLQTHVARNLIPEVRSETVCFYGPIDCLEAQYPGLDYANPAHRVRLGQYPWHRKLFQVFNELRLSEHEIQTLCRWEGTRWARERYEKDEGVKIRDTTWDGVEPAVHKEPTAAGVNSFKRQTTEEEVEDISEDAVSSDNESDDEEMGSSDDQNEVAEQEESEDELQQSIGADLHQRLLRATEARARGEEAILDEDWEQWLKEAAERGGVPDLLDVPVLGFNESHVDSSEPHGHFNPRMFRLDPDPYPESQISAIRPRLQPPPFVSLAQTTVALITASSIESTGNAV